MGNILYEGVLVDYELSSDGGLEHIQLKETHRKYLINNSIEPIRNCHKLYGELYPTSELQFSKSDSRQIPGHIIILPYKTIINLNVSYYKLIKISDDEYDVQLVN